MSPGAAQVAVLLATYNGAAYLPGQLASLSAQTHTSWRLWVSDDGSADATLEILGECRRAWGEDKIKLLSGPGRGARANFLSLAAHPAICADYYAFSDQDDVWRPGKLARALERLAPLGQERPALYCGRTVWIDGRGRALGRSPLMNRRPPSFLNALVQCLAGGNTMVFNRAARELLAARPDLAAAMHDWWAYQLVSGCGGRVVYDPEPQVGYRQHGGNIVGRNRGLSARWVRLRGLFGGKMREYLEANLAALTQMEGRLTPAGRAQFRLLAELRGQAGPFRRLRSFLSGGFHRQDRAEQLALGLAVLLGRV